MFQNSQADSPVWKSHVLRQASRKACRIHNSGKWLTFRDSPPLVKRQDLYKGHPCVNSEFWFLWNTLRKWPVNTEGSNPQQFILFFTTSIMDVVKGKLHQVAKIKLPYLSHSKKVNIKSLSAVPTQQKKKKELLGERLNLKRYWSCFRFSRPFTDSADQYSFPVLTILQERSKV